MPPVSSTLPSPVPPVPVNVMPAPLTVSREEAADKSSVPSLVTPDTVPPWDNSSDPVIVPPRSVPVSATVPAPAVPVARTLPVLLSVPSMNTVPPVLLTVPMAPVARLSRKCSFPPLASAIVPEFENATPEPTSKSSPFEMLIVPWLVKLPPPRRNIVPLVSPASIVPALTIASAVLA